MAVSSVRDVIVKDDDLVAATHGRGFWILDDITPLRQMDAASADSDVILFKPTTAWRVRWNTSVDMPWPKEEPTAPNPAGRRDHQLLPEVAGERSGHARDPAAGWDGSSGATRAAIRSRQFPRRPRRRRRSTGIVRRSRCPPPRACIASPGTSTISRLTGLSLGEDALSAVPTQLPIQAIPGNTVPAPTTPWVNPGTYT